MIQSFIMYKRHEGHSQSHYANVKYGYYVLLISLFALLFIAIKPRIRFFSRKRVARTTGVIRAWYLRGSLVLTVLLWVGIVVTLASIGGSLTSLNGACKRIGRIAYSLMPLVTILSLRPSPLPGVHYTSLIVFHKWISRILVLAATVHGIGYLTYFVIDKSFYKAFRILNFLGVLALVVMFTIAISSLRPLRRRSYRVFYIIHEFSVWICIILITFHARPNANVISFLCSFTLVGQFLYSTVTTQTTKPISVTFLSSNLQLIELERTVLPLSFETGSHLRITGSWSRISSWVLPTHPYTIASLPEDSSVKLLIRAGRFSFSQNVQYSITGPFSSLNARLFDSPEKVVIFAGGSGLSLAAATKRGLEQNCPSAKSLLIWVIRDKSEIPALKRLGLDSASIYITGSPAGKTDYSETFDGDQQGLLEPDYDEELDLEFSDLSHQMEMQQADLPDALDTEPEPRPTSLDQDATLFDKSEDDDTDALLARSKGSLSLSQGRPIFSNAVAEFLTDSDKGNLNIWAVGCGPRKLVQDVKLWAVRDFRIQFTGEKYAM